MCSTTRTSKSTDLYLTESHRRIIWSITSSQLFAQRRTVNPSHGFSERKTYPAHGNIPYIGAHSVPYPSHRGTTHPSHRHTQIMGFLTPHKGTQCSVFVSRGTTHPSHGHTQLMGSLSGRLTQSVPWRLSHVAVIINMVLGFKVTLFF